jgi:hypothetical protein
MLLAFAAVQWPPAVLRVYSNDWRYQIIFPYIELFSTALEKIALDEGLLWFWYKYVKTVLQSQKELTRGSTGNQSNAVRRIHICPLFWASHWADWDVICLELTEMLICWVIVCLCGRANSSDRLSISPTQTNSTSVVTGDFHPRCCLAFQCFSCRLQCQWQAIWRFYYGYCLFPHPRTLSAVKCV